MQKWGEPAEIIQSGDIVWIPPSVKHWHGATDTTIMSHIAIQEMFNSKTAEWLEYVSDEQYENALKFVREAKLKV